MQNDPQQQQPYYPPQFQPAPPPARKPKRWPWIVALILTALIFYSAGRASNTAETASTATTAAASSHPAQSATQKPPPTTKPLTWQTTHTFSGNGIKKTEVFAVPSNWKLQWKCDPASFSPSYNVIATIYSAEGTLQDVAVNTLCKDGNTSGETDEHQAGNIYLDVNSEGSWTLAIQEQK